MKIRKIIIRVAAVLLLAVLAEGAAQAEQVSALDSLIKSQVETAVSMLAGIDNRQRQGKMSMEQAKELGADLLRNLRYGTDGYFWADTEEGVNVVLYGRKDTEGRNRIGDQDAAGVHYVKNFLAAGKSGGGFVEYLFPKIGHTEPQAKRSYVMPFAPFGWVVGTGYYRTDLGRASGTRPVDPMAVAVRPRRWPAGMGSARP